MTSGGEKDQRVQRSLGDNQIKSAKLYIKNTLSKYKPIIYCLNVPRFADL